MIRHTALLAAVILAASTLPAHAALQLDLNYVFSGTAPSGPAPWLTATFENAVAPNTVKLTLTTSGLVNNEFVSKWYLNFHDALNVALLQFAYDPASTGPAATVSLGPNAFKADGDGFYDILLDFPTANNAGQRFTTGKVVEYTITSTEAISENSFDFLSQPKKNSTEGYKSAAHIQAEACDNSGWIGVGAPGPVVPEPASLVVWSALAGLAVVFGCRRRCG